MERGRGTQDRQIGLWCAQRVPHTVCVCTKLYTGMRNQACHTRSRAVSVVLVALAARYIFGAQTTCSLEKAPRQLYQLSRAPNAATPAWPHAIGGHRTNCSPPTLSPVGCGGRVRCRKRRGSDLGPLAVCAGRAGVARGHMPKAVAPRRRGTSSATRGWSAGKRKNPYVLP